jgi:hypothetical protein
MYPLRWEAVTDYAQEFLTEELSQEVAPGHVLYGRPVRVVAKCRRCDDTVVRVGALWAVVHLSWSRPDRPPWPSTVVGATLEAVLSEFEDKGH